MFLTKMEALLKNQKPHQIIEINGHKYKRFKRQNQIRAAINQLGSKISNDFKNSAEPPILMEVQSGSKYFLVDLHRAMTIEAHVDAIGIQSYPQDEQKGPLKISAMHRSDIYGRDVIIVEDIIDSANTIQFLKKFFSIYNPRSISVVSLVVRDLPNSPKFEVVDYYGFAYQGEEWLVGYGMDSNQGFRNMQSIWYKTD